MKVSAIIVTYNRLALLKECINKLFNQSYELDYIFIVNNNSTDGTTSYLNNLSNFKFKIKNLNKNIGGAGGFHTGLDFAFKESDSDYFWLMDDDTMPTKSSLSALINIGNKLHNNFGFLCSDVKIYGTNIHSSANIPALSNDWNSKIDDSIIKVKTATFVSILISRSIVKNYGLPIREMFIWGDDTEYTNRLSNNLPSYFVPNSVVMHKISLNRPHEDIYNSPLSKIDFYKLMYRNLLYIDYRYYSFKRFIKDIVLDIFELFNVWFKSENHRFKRFNAIFLGIVHGVFFNPKIKFPNKND